ncbi:glutathione hydrolase 1 proenzyme-like isoform X2 [Aricia agestis]|uniref:glutathione hydrolase 1 proenzyme-like isoform X2 n=1 Tax=Aricia agestis TaxID=91739 RepID=UPI001C2016C7|nr:glutathione hydrolase 1 proenzyme-like isoform X2 [Aricia agestis]
MSDKGLLRHSSLRKNGSSASVKKNVLIRVPDSHRERPYKLRTKLIISVLIVLFIAGGLTGYFLGLTDKGKPSEPPDPVLRLRPSASLLHTFKKAAVCTDNPACSEIGRNILQQNGSAVDATIAAMFCNGLLNQQSMGIGGGFFMTVYIREEGKAYSIIARETAPGSATVDMYSGQPDKARFGPLAHGVPGEVRGMWAAYQRWGRLPWASLVQPTLDFCETGFNVSQVMYDMITVAPYAKDDPILRRQLFDTKANKFHPPGTRVKPSAEWCRTLKIIAEKGGDDLYNGTLAVELLDDLKKAGSIITADDLKNYKAKVTDPIAVKLANGDTLYTPPPPSSGAVLVNILNILSSYNFTADSIKGLDNEVLTYHRIIEAFKYAYAVRTKLGDTDFLDLREYIANITSPQFGIEVRQKINDTLTSNDPEYYGAEGYSKDDHGTAHISVMADNGDAVSLTSSINYYFGAGYVTEKTGIILNDVMDDFSSPGFTNQFGLQPSPANFIAPGKRPQSSMCPSIIVDKDGNVRLVIGAAGGTKITTAVALVAIRKLWFGETVKEAIDHPRFHHQLIPMTINYEFGLTHDILDGLRSKGHNTTRYRDRGSIVCALYKNKTAIYANSDFRKGGDVAGMD